VILWRESYCKMFSPSSGPSSRNRHSSDNGRSSKKSFSSPLSSTLGRLPSSSSALPSLSSQTTSANGTGPPSSILVGYAFGPKKMSTMGIIMAEASKASRYFSVIEESSVLATSTTSVAMTLNAHALFNKNISEVDNSVAAMATTSNVCCGDGGEVLQDLERDGDTLLSGCTTKAASSNASVPTPIDSSLLGDDESCFSTVSFSRAGATNVFFPKRNSKAAAPPETYTSVSGDDDNDSSNMSCTASCTSTISSRTALVCTNIDNVRITTPSITSMKWKNSVSSVPMEFKTSKINVSFVPVDLDTPLEEQHGGNFDVILHKMTEDILTISNASAGTTLDEKGSIERSVDGKRALERIKRLENYKLKHYPTCHLVDSPDRIKTLMSREDIAFVLNESLVGITSRSGIPVRAPRFVVCKGDDRVNLEQSTTAEACFLNKTAELIDRSPFTYPLIAKPMIAAGTADSHKLGIVLGREGLKRLQMPCILQEYYNHDASLFKVYVLGDDVFVFHRPSLPNLPIGECSNNASGSFVEFDSQRPYPNLSDLMGESNTLLKDKCVYKQGESIYKRYKIDTTSPSAARSFVTEDEIEPVVKTLRKAFGLELFGFDVLVTSSQHLVESVESSLSAKEILVVDVNYFPSYKEVSNFPALLSKYLTQQAINRRNEMKPII